MRMQLDTKVHGMSEADALAHFEAQGWRAHVASRDGEEIPKPETGKPIRVLLTVAAGVVTGIAVIG